MSEKSRFALNSIIDSFVLHKGAAENYGNNEEGDTELWPDAATHSADCSAELGAKIQRRFGFFFTRFYLFAHTPTVLLARVSAGFNSWTETPSPYRNSRMTIPLSMYVRDLLGTRNTYYTHQSVSVYINILYFQKHLF